MTLGFECKLLPQEPILLTTFSENFNPREDTPRIAQEMKSILDASSEPIYMVDDLLRLKMSFSDLVSMMAAATRGDTGVVLHPNVRQIVLVSTNDVVRLGSAALKQAQYGGKSTVSVHPTLEEALSAIRAEMASEGAAVKSR